ncbi:tetratricopeptide repeat protein [Corallococcus sp. AB011P]|uniref:tetratricopeptide repeat protein n=1 Tax=unclassified Corallococcus TaxID=2685029 RepID=UPI000EA08907|nr:MULTISPECIES: tetratricopeptide repeat protein [unclassified Corallococcus]RKG50126.1 tetratricopeptide repeat protein [Corallococcus sp. AB011P]RKH89132.1 tetratricopeptide repeat protein [Corallococcus sp. AB045]
MYNLLISLAIGLAVGVLVKFAGGFSWWAGIVPGVIVFFATYIVLARRVSTRVQALMTTVQNDLQGQPANQKEAQGRVDRAVKTLEQGLVWDKWQFLIGPEIHAQIGMLKYMVKDLDGAKPHLEKASGRNYMAKAMAGALHFRRNDVPAMKTSFEAAVKSGKKESIVWAVYAWCLLQLKDKDSAQRVLARGVELNPSDEKLKGSLAQLQNDKRLKMKPYEPLWWQFGLEAPPMMPPQGGGRRVQFTNRR